MSSDNERAEPTGHSLNYDGGTPTKGNMTSTPKVCRKLFHSAHKFPTPPEELPATTKVKKYKPLPEYESGSLLYGPSENSGDSDLLSSDERMMGGSDDHQRGRRVFTPYPHKKKAARNLTNDFLLDSNSSKKKTSEQTGECSFSSAENHEISSAEQSSATMTDDSMDIEDYIDDETVMTAELDEAVSVAARIQEESRLRRSSGRRSSGNEKVDTKYKMQRAFRYLKESTFAKLFSKSRLRKCRGPESPENGTVDLNLIDRQLRNGEIEAGDDLFGYLAMLVSSCQEICHEKQGLSNQAEHLVKLLAVLLARDTKQDIKVIDTIAENERDLQYDQSSEEPQQAFGSIAVKKSPPSSTDSGDAFPFHLISTEYFEDDLCHVSVSMSRQGNIVGMPRDEYLPAPFYSHTWTDYGDDDFDNEGELDHECEVAAEMLEEEDEEIQNPGRLTTPFRVPVCGKFATQNSSGVCNCCQIFVNDEFAEYGDDRSVMNASIIKLRNPLWTEPTQEVQAGPSSVIGTDSSTYEEN